MGVSGRRSVAEGLSSRHLYPRLTRRYEHRSRNCRHRHHLHRYQQMQQHVIFPLFADETPPSYRLSYTNRHRGLCRKRSRDRHVPRGYRCRQ